MTAMTLTALYDSRAEADQAGERLVRETGVARSDVTVHAQEANASGGASTAGGAGESTGLFGSLKNMFMPEEDRHAYSEAIGRGGFLLTARVEQGAAERATAILEEHGAVDLDDRQQSWRAGGPAGRRGRRRDDRRRPEQRPVGAERGDPPGHLLARRHRRQLQVAATANGAAGGHLPRLRTGSAPGFRRVASSSLPKTP